MKWRGNGAFEVLICILGILSHFYTLNFRLFMYMIYQMTVMNNMYYRSVCLVHPLDVFPEGVASGSVGPKSPLLAG
jgi:hypothetical protein